MKTLIMLAFILQAAIIPKGSDTIVVKATLEQIKNALNTGGWTVVSYEKDFGVIKTDYKKVQNYTSYIHLQIKLVGDSAIIQGGNDDNLIVEYTNGIFKKQFEEMNRFALSIDSNLTYKTIR